MEAILDVICPATPKPPDTTSAPEEVVELAVVLVMLVIPLAVKEVVLRVLVVI